MESNLIEDPLFVDGVKKYLFDVTLETQFVNLLSFLREIEFQENIILLENIVCSRKNNRMLIIEFGNIRDLLQVKIKMIFYGKN